ncbi:MAG TPA: hypothetical protein VKX40_10325 [Aequorivita sp.]|nr:hypothetical protein [Aequorivita sp.]
MDELELLKKQWSRQESDLPRLSYEDIYKMILKKSSSIVKWIFLISIGEIILWSCLALLVSDSDQKFIQDIGLGNAMLVANILYYLIVVSFIILFYRNYKKISTTDSVKDLMQNILRTRKAVKFFIIFNIAGAGIMILGINVFYYFNQDLMFQLMIENQGISPTMNKDQFISMFFIIQLVLGVLIIGAVFVFYRLVYGILLRRLNKNYKELKKIEI